MIDDDPASIHRKRVVRAVGAVTFLLLLFSLILIGISLNMSKEIDEMGMYLFFLFFLKLIISLYPEFWLLIKAADMMGVVKLYSKYWLLIKASDMIGVVKC